MYSLINSLKKNKTGIVLILIASLCTTMGQYLWKMSDTHNLIYILAGFLLYGIGAVGMIIAFRYGSFSVIHPMMSMGYIFAILVGYFMLNEVIGVTKVIGLVLIMLGVAFIGVGDE